jgi:hypothetical protein
MTNTMRALIAFRHLYPSLQEHRKVEAETLRLLRNILPGAYLGAVPPPAGLLKYARRHFFSSLFLAVYRSAGVTPERRLFYGGLNHAIRGIVTGTDNLLDDEYKEMLPLAFPERATRFKSVMHILLFDRILARLLDEATTAGLVTRDQAASIGHEIFTAMVPIGAEEATEEGGVAGILTPAEILSSVHMYKGGNLLRLAFVAPLLAESGEVRARLEQADRGIFSIGLALQVIDDLTDFHDDLRDHRHNYLAATIYHEGPSTEQARLAALLGGGERTPVPVEQAFAVSASRAMTRAIGEALDGFERLHEAGFWLDRPQALELIRYLFNLRGVGHLLPLLPSGYHFTETLDIHHAA